jgi:hypothetical protein
VGPSRVGDDVFGFWKVVKNCLLHRLESGNKGGGGGCLGADKQAGGCSPLHANHMDVQEPRVIMEGLVDFGDKVYKGRAMSVRNAALEPDYHLRKLVAFLGRWLVFGLGSLRRRGRRGRVCRSRYFDSISKALEGAGGLILETLKFLIYCCHH